MGKASSKAGGTAEAAAESATAGRSAQERDAAGSELRIPVAPVLAPGETLEKTPDIPRAPVVGKESDGTSIIVRTMRELRAQEKVKIVIPSSETDKEPVTVSINGYAYRILRDTPVDVPKSVYKALLDAKMTTYTQRKREDGEGNELVPTKSLRYPVSRV